MKRSTRLTTGDYAPNILLHNAGYFPDEDTSILFAEPGLPLITITPPSEPHDHLTRRQRKWEKYQQQDLLCVPERNLKRKSKQKRKALAKKLGERARHLVDVGKRLTGGLVEECERMSLNTERDGAGGSRTGLKKAPEHENRQQTGVQRDKQWRGRRASVP